MKDEGAEQRLEEEEGTMKSPVLEVRNPSKEVPQHRTVCIPLEREPAVGTVARPT